MNYESPELLDHLAAAYVLGTLRGRARRRFVRLAKESSTIQRAIWRWEQQLLPLSDAVDPQTPAAQNWTRIEERLGFKEKPRRIPWLWPVFSAALLLALVAVLLPGLLLTEQTVNDAAERLAYIQDDEKQPLWVVTVDEDSGRLSALAINAPARDADRVFQLWMLPESGPPESFGLLPAAQNPRMELTLTPALLALLENAAGLAVSIEPVGGSPTGAPTGPVVYTAPVVTL